MPRQAGKNQEKESVLALAADLRRLDRDRYLCILAAPPEREQAGALIALYLLNAELSRSAEVTREPLMADLRLKWWYDALADAAKGNVRAQPILQALAPAFAETRLPLTEVQALVELRQQEMDDRPFADLAAMVRHAEASSGRLARLASLLLGGTAREAQAASGVGSAFALLGLLRAAGHHAMQGRLLLPADVADAAGATVQSVREGRRGEDLAPLAKDVAELAERALSSARAQQTRLPPGRASPFLLAPLADLYLRRLRRAQWNPLSPSFVMAPPARAWRLLRHRIVGRT